MRARLVVLGLALLPLLAACPRKPEGLDVVRGFELERYLGRWHEIARLDHRFERGLVEVTAEYSRRDDGGIDVSNHGWDCEDARWRDAKGRAYFVGAPDVGELKVSFFRPFYSSYNIAVLDPEYRYAMMVGDERRYLWILARTPELPDDVRQQLIAQAAGLGFDTTQLIFPGARANCRALDFSGFRGDSTAPPPPSSPRPAPRTPRTAPARASGRTASRRRRWRSGCRPRR